MVNEIPIATVEEIISDKLKNNYHGLLELACEEIPGSDGSRIIKVNFHYNNEVLGYESLGYDKEDKDTSSEILTKRLKIIEKSLGNKGYQIEKKSDSSLKVLDLSKI